MTRVTFRNNPVHASGNLPTAGQTAPAFTLATVDLSDKALVDFVGKCKVLNILLSVDIGVYAQPVRTFNKHVSSLDNTAVLCISADLPFAQARFCGAEGLNKVTTSLSFRSSFATDYGVTPTDSPLCGLTACVVLASDENDKVPHSELVAEVTNEPNYNAALAAL